LLEFGAAAVFSLLLIGHFHGKSDRTRIQCGSEGLPRFSRMAERGLAPVGRDQLEHDLTTDDTDHTDKRSKMPFIRGISEIRGRLFLRRNSRHNPGAPGRIQANG
jgi:hypothetical protein